MEPREWIVPSIPTNQTKEKQSLIARKSDPKDGETGGILSRFDHIRCLKPRQENEENLEPVTIANPNASSE
jgi:hypothetical protein